MIRFGPAASPPQIWAIEDDTAQLTWGDLPAGPLTVKVQDQQHRIDHRGGPGAVLVDRLVPDSPFSIELLWDGGRLDLKGRTLASPPGELLTRFATISDLHLGAERWGALKTMVDTSGNEVPHPYRCASAAIDEALSWGAELLVIKGDAAQHERETDFEELARLVDAYPDLPMLLIPGNHDVDGRDSQSPGTKAGYGNTIPLTVGRRQLPFTRRVDRLDIPGVRIIVGDTTIPGRGRGSLARTGAAIIGEVESSDRPVFVGLHHQLQPGRIPRYWPPGIEAPSSTRFLDRLNASSVPVVVSSGHTHRNRSRLHGDVLITEVASTKDWPGVWAGYAVHEGGIRQVVRRTMGADAIQWTEYSRGALNGLWSMWSPGPIKQRCLSRPWAQRGSLV